MKSLSKVVAAVALAAALSALPLTAAHAAPGGVEVSPDGVIYTSTMTGALFTSISKWVPGDRDEASFYLRNSSSEPGHLRITLRDVVSSSTDLASALTVSAKTFVQSGAVVTVLEADPCWVLLEGQVVAPGEAVRVTMSMALGDLHGQAGQGATANAAINVALTGTSVQLPPTVCGQSGATLPVVTQPTVPRSPASSTGTGAGIAIPGSGEDELSVAEPSTDLPVLNLPTPFGIDPNTWHLFEEYLILIPIGASVLGGTAFGIVAWRRRNTAQETGGAA